MVFLAEKQSTSRQTLVSPIINAEINSSVETISQATGDQVRYVEGHRRASLYSEESEDPDTIQQRPSALLRMAEHNIEHDVENHHPEPAISSAKADVQATNSQPEQANGGPVDNVSRTHTESHDEQVIRSPDGKVKVVKSSISESKEYVHRIQKSFPAKSPETSISEFSDLPRVRTSTDQRKHTTVEVEPSPSSTPVTVVRNIDGHTYESPKVYRSSPVDRSERPPVMPRPIIPQSVTHMVPAEQHEAMKRQLESEIAYLKSITSPSQQHGEEQTSRELLHRRIIMLESDLRDSRNVSELVSEELQNLRKQYEFLINRSLQLENSNRTLQDKIREYKSANKKMVRDLQDREALLEKLHESHAREKKTQRHLSELQEEQSRLARDYEILRQSYQRKEHQLGGLFSERADLYRRLDESEYDKILLERQLEAKGRSKRPVTHQIYSSANQRTKTQSADRPRTEDDTFISGAEMTEQHHHTIQIISGQPELDGEITNQVETTEKQELNNYECAALDETQTETKTAEATLPVDTQMSPDDHTIKVTLPVDSADATTKSQKAAEKVSYHHPVQQSPSLYPRNTRLDRRSGTDSAEEEIFHFTTSPLVNLGSHWEESRYRNYRTSSLGKRFNKRVTDMYMPRSPVRYVRRPRPSSAYGFTPAVPLTADYEIYRNPLPRRSTTSLGHLPPPRSWERDYARFERPTISRYQTVYPETPDPFRYDTMRPTRAEIMQLEDELFRLQREKRNLEKLCCYHNSSRHIKSYRRSDDLFYRLVQVNSDIRCLQMRLDGLKAVRRANTLK
ncbi:hypothetical protein CRM22_002367 [Opisthorchis felineus]|uniref:Uncharacterized protein n=2 Tax=Opisthorchis felineus TaxID=147828 RepID=A0A4V3SGE2_OPIFE|nr:hypothetical protein CRM22_002367 [Opisthorchis felineus]